MRRVGAGEKAHRLIGDVEVLIGNIERNREDRPRRPLESLLGVALEPNRGRAPPFVNVDQRLEHMMLRLGLLAGGNLADIGIVLLLLAHVQVGAERPHARPRLDLDVHQVFDKKAGDRGDTLFLLKQFISCQTQLNRVAVRQSHESNSPCAKPNVGSYSLNVRNSIFLAGRNCKVRLFRYQLIWRAPEMASRTSSNSPNQSREKV